MTSLGKWFCIAIALPACVDTELEQGDDESTESQSIRGNASSTGTGELDAVGWIGNCTATLITKETVLTAAHCVCPDEYPDSGSCATARTFTFDNVLPVGSTVRQDVSIPAEVIVHPEFGTVSWLGNDYALLRLETPADQLVQVTPIRVASAMPPVGQTHTIVGYGGFGPGCASNNDGVKRRGNTVLDEVLSFASPGGSTLIYNDNDIGSCPGDSGGPALDPSGRVVGVASSANFSTNSNYDATAAAWPWLQANACPHFDPDFPDAGFCNDAMCPCAPAEGDCDSDSQCKSGSVCVNNIGAAAGLDPGWDVCWGSNELVRVYRDASFAGVSQALPVGTWDVGDLAAVGNDQISSVSARPGLTVRLYAEAGCWGTTQAFTGAASTLGTMNNRTSCLRIDPGVTLYRSTSHGGTSQTFTAGTYAAASLTTIGNDQAESLIASPGIVVRLCSESGGWGNCQSFSGSPTTLGTLNNNVSYVQVQPGVTVYRGEDFTGVTQSFPQGTFGSASLTTVGNDQITSIVVAPGMQATLCSENGGWGNCQTFTGWNSFVGTTLDNNTSNIVVAPL